MEENAFVNVTNRDSGQVGYTLPDKNLHRTFAVGETKKISLEELQQLSYVSGGEYILKNCLIVNNTDALSALNLEVEPEYFYTETEVRKILTEGSLDQLEDCLNFAPDGVLDLIKKIAVEEELPDTRKRKLISEKTGFNIDNAINVNHIVDADSGSEDVEEAVPKRKAAPLNTESGAPTRKVATPSKYNVVKK
jgi:hypothetical protein